jgi:hypothetical protein
MSPSTVAPSGPSADWAKADAHASRRAADIPLAPNRIHWAHMSAAPSSARLLLTADRQVGGDGALDGLRLALDLGREM